MNAKLEEIYKAIGEKAESLRAFRKGKNPMLISLSHSWMTWTKNLRM